MYEQKGLKERALEDFKKAHDLGMRNPDLFEKLRKYGALP